MKWFSIGGIVSEIRKIEWPTPKQLMKEDRKSTRLNSSHRT